MNIHHTFPRSAFFLLLLSAAHLSAQDCTQPVVLNSILVSNTTCSNSTGTIILTPAGGASNFLYLWDPLVSASNVATNLPAGAYHVQVTRITEPTCTLDTTIVVNNSNGPMLQVSIDPADCLNSNGAVTLSPTNLNYQWSNGATGATVTGLASDCYEVTATNAATGCFSVVNVCVPTENPLIVLANVTQQAKCGRSIGKAEVEVTGGSGAYSYSLGPFPNYENLAPGNYTCAVSDNQTGCSASVAFTVLDLPVSGTVNVNPYNVRCAGGSNGFVEFFVSPGQNFKSPFTFSLLNAVGQPQSPGSLIAGQYFLTILDADSCALPAQAFTIAEPPPFSAQAVTNAETCAAGGSILLSPTGGNGTPYIVNWADLPGDNNPEDRLNLAAGIYSATVYDSLFCNYSLGPFLVQPQCNRRDTTHMVVAVNATDFYCETAPIGVSGTTYSLVGGGLSGSSAYGVWTLNAEGCLAYTAGLTTGFEVDLVCVVRTNTAIGLKDTTCVFVSITQKQPTKQSVFFTVQAGSAGTACGTIPPGFANSTILQLGRPGLSGTSDVYGTYLINVPSACVTFQAAEGVSGFNVDEIRVAVYDTLNDDCHIIGYLPTVLPMSDCSSAAALPDSIHLVTTNCDGVAFGCVPIPYEDIVNYTIIDNGALYANGYLGCNLDTAVSYNIAALPPGGGPYQLLEWKINGVNNSGNFLNINGLVALLNQIDPAPGWASQGVSFVRGGNPANTYGPLRVRSAVGNIGNYEPTVQLVPLGTELRFAPGVHQIIFRNVLTACADTMVADVVCYDCAPIHGYPLDVFGNVKWDADGCSADTVFCTNIPDGEIGQYSITDNNVPIADFLSCNGTVGMRLDTGYHQLHFVNNITTCEYYVRFYLDCRDVVAGDTLREAIPLGEDRTICLDTTFLSSPIVSIFNLCQVDGGSEVVSYAYDEQHWCLDLTALGIGADTLCIQLCNANGQCADYLVLLSVYSPTDSLLAVPDQAYTLKDESIEIPILENDLINGVPGNRAGLASVEILGQPKLGDADYDPLTGLLRYTPDAGRCGVDSFDYRLTDTLGQQSVARIFVRIICDKVLVFNGISPNGDDLNDTWKILGIEQFPNNEVWVFNRWGNLVFEQKGYSNAAPWDGRWQGRDLPDGTYFYILQLGGNEGRLDGYLQILR
jgi:gliding motility-associated-like protein